jgi:hypothetical protein
VRTHATQLDARLRLEYQAVVLLSKSAGTGSFSRFFPYQLWI